MILLIDIGNTSIRWASLEGGRVGDSQSLRHNGGAPLDLLATWDLLEAPRRVLISNVGAESVAVAIARVVRALWSLEPELAITRAECLGVRIAYAEPSRLGVDRWLALLGAHGREAGAVLIVDAGTAVTYDLLLGDGTHLGGLILPGIELMRAGLLTGTRIPNLAPGVPLDSAEDGPEAEPWGRDTAAAISLGGVQALGALADRLYDRLAERSSGPGPALLLTGGDSARLVGSIQRPCALVPDLVVRGLARLAEETS